jgi:hypothetical protein
MTGTLSNKGRHDGRSIATAAAVLYHKGSEWGHTERILGEKLTQVDIDLETMLPALLLLGDFARETNHTGVVQLITGSPSTPHQVFNFKQHATQHVSVNLAWKTNTLFAEHPHLSLILIYAK